MIQITAQMRVLVAIEPVDGRKGIDSLARQCQDKLAEDPFSGCVFVFRSRRGTAIRLSSYDGQGYWLAQKRLSKGRFVWWPASEAPSKPRAPQYLGARDRYIGWSSASARPVTASWLVWNQKCLILRHTLI
jgi:transposase